MSSLDKDSGVRDIPVPRCSRCHGPLTFTASGRPLHINPDNRCTYSS